MAQEEHYGNRSLAYSAWHRRRSTGRFVGEQNARKLAMIDMDHCMWIEYDDGTKEPLALIEEAQDVGQSVKAGTVTRNLARRAGLPALVVLWKPSEDKNPADSDQQDIAQFRVKRLWPIPESEWRTLTPKEWAAALLRMRTWHIDKLDRLLFGDRSA